MSCVLSCNTDSGVRNPTTTATLVPAGDGVAGIGAAAGAGVVVSTVSDPARPPLPPRSTGWHAARAAAAAHKLVILMGAVPPRPRPGCAAAPAGGCAGQDSPRAVSSIPAETSPLRTRSAPRGACGRPVKG